MIPYLIGYAVTGEAEKFITPLPYRVFGNDILQFAGLFFILIGFLLYKRVSDLWILIIAAAMMIPGNFLRHTDLNNPVLNIALGHFIGTQDAAGLVMSDFPVLNWFFVPAMGFVFGRLITRIKDKKKFYGITAPILLIPTVAFFVLEYIFEFGQMDSGATLVESENCYYHLMWYDAIALALLLSLGILLVTYPLALLWEHISNKRKVNR